MSAAVKPHRSTKQLAEMEQKAAKSPRAVDLLTLAILDRHEKYRVGIVLRECAGSRYVACIGQMRNGQGAWVRARTFNFRADEIDEVIAALEKAREVLE